MIDIGLNINPQAFAVLHMVRGWEGNFEDLDGLDSINAFAWYNGRERGIALAVRSKVSDGYLVLAFGEHRNSDGIFVDVYEAEYADAMFPPNHRDKAYEAAYQNRKNFNHGQAGKAAEFIVKAIEKFIKAAKKAA